jgi:hypothetical protein
MGSRGGGGVAEGEEEEQEDDDLENNFQIVTSEFCDANICHHIFLFQ